MKKPCVGVGSPASGCQGLSDAVVAESCPLFWEHLTHVKWEDGSKRIPSSFTAFYDEGWLKGCLNDKEAGLVAFVTSDSFMGLLEALEDGLREGRLEWRRARDGSRRK